MADTITLEVMRYRPDREGEPSVQAFEVPVAPRLGGARRPEPCEGQPRRQPVLPMVVPDGHLRELRHDRNGDPRLTCATFLVDYAPGPVRVEPLANFPVIRDLVVDIGDFMRKLSPSLARGSCVARIKPPSTRASTSRLPSSWRTTRSTACASTACCATPLAPSTGSTRSSSVRPRSPWRSATTSTPATRAPTSGSTCSSTPEGIWGCTFVGECTRAVPEGCPPQPERSSGTSSPPPCSEGRSSCHGGRDDAVRPMGRPFRSFTAPR